MQLTHVFAPELEYMPDWGQCTHAIDPVAAWNLPAAQAVHKMLPSAAV